MHLASDVVGGMLIAGAWAGLAIAVLRVWPAPALASDQDADSRLLRPLAAIAGLAVLGGATAAALASHQNPRAVHADPVAITGGALLVAGVAVLVVGATALCARRIG
jgi:hypothetical protein